MAFLDNCKFTPTAGGTTDWTYSSTVTGYQSPNEAQATVGLPYHANAISADGSQWEISEGIATESVGIFTFPRTTVLSNSSGTGTKQGGAGTKINFSAAPNVSIVALKEDLLAFDEANNFTTTQQNQAQKNIGLPAIFRGQIFNGLTLSTAGSSSTFGISAGCGADPTGTDFISLASAFTKTTGAWASGIGNGALDTGTIAADTWYHAFVIKDESTNAADVLISLSATAPTMPSGYTLALRLGAMETDASSHWVLFHQRDDEFLRDVSVNTSVSTSTSAALTTLGGIPTGVQAWAIMTVWGASTSTTAFISSPDVSDQAPSTTGAFSFTTAGTGIDGTSLILRTDASARIRQRASQSDTLHISVQGWRDPRGKVF